MGTKSFIYEDFAKWETGGEVIISELHTIRSITMQKKICNEVDPNTGKPWRKVEFYEWLSYEDKVIPLETPDDVTAEVGSGPWN